MSQVFAVTEEKGLHVLPFTTFFSTTAEEFGKQLGQVVDDIIEQNLNVTSVRMRFCYRYLPYEEPEEVYLPDPFSEEEVEPVRKIIPWNVSAQEVMDLKYHPAIWKLEDMEHIVRLSHHCKIETMDITGCHLSTDHARALFHMDWKHMRRFTADGNRFGLEGIMLLAQAARRAPNLEHFGLLAFDDKTQVRWFLSKESFEMIV